VRLTALAAEHRDPLTRLWLLRALHTTTEVILDGSAVLAAEAASGTGLRLDFLAGRRLPAPPAPAPFAGSAMDASRREDAMGLLTTVFDQADDHLDLTLDVALSNEFRIP